MRFSYSPLVLLLLLSLKVMVAPLPTCQLLGDMVKEAHKLLKNLSGPYPAHCLQYNSIISFPDSTLRTAGTNHRQCSHAVGMLNVILSEVADIFENNTLPVGEGGVNWDPRKLDDFQNIMYQLLDQGSCLPPLDVPGVLASYSHNVTAVIGRQDSAPCGWMALRRDLIKVLNVTARHSSCFAWRRELRRGGHAH